VSTALLCTAAVAVFLGLERLRAARSTASLYEEQIAILQDALPSEAQLLDRSEAAASRLADLENRFYAPGEMSPYAFGALIKQELSDRGLAIIRYQTATIGGRDYLEFAVEGATLGIVQFLLAVSESRKYWTVPSLTLKMHEGGRSADATFRIGCEELDGQDG
jgi:hypothetical protein